METKLKSQTKQQNNDSLTLLEIAAANACKNSFVFSASSPATILDGRTDSLLPVACTVTQNNNINNTIMIIQ